MLDGRKPEYDGQPGEADGTSSGLVSVVRCYAVFHAVLAVLCTARKSGLE